MFKTSELIWQDTQHQVLFELIDQIKEKPFKRIIFTKLQFYADAHFVLEEAYMAELNYPHVAPHIKAHNRFREELASMSDTQPELISSELLESFSIFLNEWLKRHVLGIDKELEKFILQSNSN
jgi:hemerythrin